MAVSHHHQSIASDAEMSYCVIDTLVKVVVIRPGQKAAVMPSIFDRCMASIVSKM